MSPGPRPSFLYAFVLEQNPEEGEKKAALVREIRGSDGGPEGNAMLKIALSALLGDREGLLEAAELRVEEHQRLPPYIAEL